MPDIKVTDADREAAVNLLGGSAPKGLLEGKRDSLSVIQSLARHRIEAQRPLLDALEVISREAELADVLGYGWKKAREAALAAIKQAKGE